jgi:hypothetical protein
MARGTTQAPTELREATTQIIVEKVVEVVVEPRVVQMIDLPEADSISVPDDSPSYDVSMASLPVTESRARRVSQAYQAIDTGPRKPLVIA